MWNKDFFQMFLYPFLGKEKSLYAAIIVILFDNVTSYRCAISYGSLRKLHKWNFLPEIDRVVIWTILDTNIRCSLQS